MQIKQLVLGQFATNSYIVSKCCPGLCILIDPADEAGRIMDVLGQLKLEPEAVILTHGHYDHFLAVPDLQKQWFGLPVYCHSLDCPKETEEYDMGQVFPTVTAFSNITSFTDRQKLSVAGFDITVLHTPGHTKGSVTLKIEDALFTGDTLFRGSIGRTDFAGGDEVQMMASLKKIALIEGDYRVFPGHEGITTLDKERRHNFYLKAAAKNEVNISF